MHLYLLTVFLQLQCAPMGSHLEAEPVKVEVYGSRAAPELLPKMVADKSPVEDLRIGWAGMGDGPLETVAKLSGLNTLRVSNATRNGVGVTISTAGWRSLANLATLRELVVNDVDIDERTIVGIADLAQVRRLYLAHNDMTDEAIAKVAAMTQLEALSLLQHQMTDESARIIAKLTNLRHLDISQTKITDDTVSRIAQLQKLEYLNLTSTQVTPEGVRELAGHPSLRRLLVQQRQVSTLVLRELHENNPELVVQITDAKLTKAR